MTKTSRLLIVVLVSLFLSLLDGRLAVPVDCQERAPSMVRAAMRWRSEPKEDGFTTRICCTT